MLLAVIANHQQELRLIHVKTTFNILDFTISLGSLSTILSLLIITVMLLARFIAAQRAEGAMEAGDRAGQARAAGSDPEQAASG